MSSDFDEDQNVPYANPPGDPRQDRAGNVRLVAHGSDRAPLHEDRQPVLLEVFDASNAGERFGLDLVAVLDVSESMTNNPGGIDRLDKMKKAMHFVIRKLRPIDRLSIVTFSRHAEMLCPLRSVTVANQAHLKDLVDGLRATGNTNIRDGLETGLGVLARRRVTGGRIAAVFLLSDGDQNNGDALLVDVRHVPVYTFGFGTDYDPKVLDEIARKSKGGTFSFVEDGENMTEPFSQILGGLLSIVVQDLKLIVSPQPGDSIIEYVDSGIYPQFWDSNSGSVTVHFGDLFAREVRRVIVDIILPEVNRKKDVNVLTAQCSYSVQGKHFYSPRFPVTMRRTSTGSADPIRLRPLAVRTEQARRRHVTFLEDARTMADSRDLQGADGKLVEARADLEREQTNPMIDMLRASLDRLLAKIRSPGHHAGFGAYLRSLKTSHDRERVAATGDVKGARLFETPYTSRFKLQGKQFDKQSNSTMGRRPPVDHDPREEEKETRRLREQGQGRRTERPVAVDAWSRPWKTWWGDDDKRDRRSSSSNSRSGRSRCALLMCILCLLLVIGAVVLGILLLAVYNHKTPFLAVADAQLGALDYAAEDGTVKNLQLSIAFLAINKDSKADGSFSRLNLALKLHGVDMLLLRAPPFVVPPDSSLPVQYVDVVSSGRRLDKAGMRSMDKSISAGVVPFDLHGKVRTSGNAGIFRNVQFWARVSCRLRFLYPGNGTLVLTDRRKCRSRWP